MLPLERAMTSGFAMMLALGANMTGWPIAKGGSQAIADALAAYFGALGGEIATGVRVENLAQLPNAKAVLLDVTPRQFLAMAGDRLPQRARRRWQRFRYGPGVFKMDWALAGPVPWRSPLCRQTATLHLGPSLEEIAAAERAPWENRAAEKPFVLVVQPSLFDPTRAPPGRQTLWAYCHVPHGSTQDMTARIEAQIERFAPGFGKLILQRSSKNTAAMQDYNANYIGGDINGGVQDLAQHLRRPVALRRPYATPVDGVYLCSSSTPPGGGVHGLCGFFAARLALSDIWPRTSRTPLRPGRD
jgi:phytoene dehydrogenase-like protein